MFCKNIDKLSLQPPSLGVKVTKKQTNRPAISTLVSTQLWFFTCKPTVYNIQFVKTTINTIHNRI